MEANDYQRLARGLRTSHLYVEERKLTYFAHRECPQWVEGRHSTAFALVVLRLQSGTHRRAFKEAVAVTGV
jgi:hypothetical protein